MFKKFTQPIAQIISRANSQAHGFSHGYVGTEHLLLALAEEEGSPVAEALATLGVRADNVRTEIEKLVQRGPETIPQAELPLTPRAKRAIGFAIAEATLMKVKQAGGEHLLLGLVREESGVAAQVMRNLGVTLPQLRAELFKVRLMQIKIVERAVRPVRAGPAGKRKMREELLAHLTAIYEEEETRTTDPAEAMQEAARRFGNPTELARQLDATVRWSERMAYYTDRVFGWRAPESAARFVARTAVQVFVMSAAVCLLIAAAAMAKMGWGSNVWTVLRPFVALAFVVPAIHFVLGLAYFRMRDALFGVFGSRKSLLRAVTFDLLIAVSVIAAGVSFTALAAWDIAPAMESLPASGVGGIAVAAAVFLYARFHGPNEITDTLWACLPLETAS